MLKSPILTITVSAIFWLTSSIPTIADDCGESDSVRLPDCVAELAAWGEGRSGFWIHNNCDYDMVVKFDLDKCEDKIIEVRKGTASDVIETSCALRKVICCPRSSQCGG